MDTKKRQDLERAEQMVERCSTDPLQLLSLAAPDTFCFFGPDDCGVVFYTLAGHRALSLGDPVCEEKDLPRLIGAYIDFCNGEEYRCIFNSVNQKTADALKAVGFVSEKYGEEGILTLATYDLAGGKKGSLRRNTAKLNREGCTVSEYRITEGRDAAIEKEILDLYNAWQDEKQLNLSYSVGELQFERPCGRRYFFTRDADGKMITVLSFLPYADGSGYCVDVMYRHPDGPTGAMEHAIISAAWVLRDEGASEISLNIAPLAGIDPDSPESSRIERLMHAMFCSTNIVYDFKGLYRFKEKFVPSVWRPRYLVHDPRISLVRLARSIANVKGAADLTILGQYGWFFLTYILTPNRYQNIE